MQITVFSFVVFLKTRTSREGCSATDEHTVDGPEKKGLIGSQIHRTSVKNDAHPEVHEYSAFIDIKGHADGGIKAIMI